MAQFPPPKPVRTVAAQPYHAQPRQDWAVAQERQRHADALYRVGEYAVFVMMWALLDFEAGLVARCTRCYGTSGSIQQRISAVYDQPTQNACPDCFGTTFEGGIRAKIVRPSIWTETDETEKQDRKGTVHPVNASVETTWDFRMRQGDYVFRADGSRYRLPASPQRVTLRSGFAHPSQAQTSITYDRIQARLEEPTTVCYKIPPVKSVLATLLVSPRQYPADFSAFEVVPGYLIPTGATALVD